MNRRAVVCAMVLVLASAGCARASGAPRSAPRAPAPHGLVTVAWSVAVAAKPSAIAADAHGVVVTLDHEGVVALDREGGVRWVASLDGASIGAPVLTDSVVIVPTARLDGSGGCVALDRETGATRWNYEWSGSTGVAATRVGALAICVMRDGVTAGIALTSGFVQWQVVLASDAPRSTVEIPEHTALAVDGADGLFAFTARVSGEWILTWRDIDTGADEGLLDLGDAGAPSAAVVVGRGEFAAAASDPSELCVVDAGSLRVTRIPVPAAEGFEPASVPLVVQRLVVVAARAGEVTAIDLDRRRPRWTAHASARIRATHPDLVANAVMLATGSGPVDAFRISDGTPIRLPPAPGTVIAAAADTSPGEPGPNGVTVVGRGASGGRIERWVPSR